MLFSNSELLKSLQTGFIDSEFVSDNNLVPTILINDKIAGNKILTPFLSDLESCEYFWFSAAFLTTSGLATLKNSLAELFGKNVKGKILVSQYLNFTQPEALRQLLMFKNIQLRINIDMNFHAKGYLFKKTGYYNLIIGSSNLTAAALTTNKELNIRTSATENSHVINRVLEDFNHTFENSKVVDPEYIRTYQEIFKLNSNSTIASNIINNAIVPNSMQIDALSNLENLRKTNKNKALLISATGTGKTYLSAFDAKKVNPKKLLFLVHRSNIAQKAMESYRQIFGMNKKMGMFTGGFKDLDSDFIFSTIQTMSRQDNLNQFDREHFEYIVIDETHRAGADSYIKILEHYKPNFLLGMTATPERTDGYDIFKHFDYNIAYEIRLHKALEENMLAPFHYYGVADVSVNGEIISETSAFQLLTADERVKRIIEKTIFYGSDSGTIRGLVFCSRVEEAKYLSKEFNKKGYRTISLSGDNTELERSKAIDLLESDGDDRIDYIFSVDIFNEGIDIPRINQIIMLRPTQSAIIFVQQLGRGLRKTEGKEYLTIIDFIGNYSNNFLVPIALYGDSSYNKDTLRKLLAAGSSLMPGESTVNFDKISKEKIFKSIDTANLTLKRDLVKDYELLKYKIGRVPMMVDFIEHGSRDPELFVDYSRSYYNFIEANDSSYKVRLNKKDKKYLELFSNEINNGIRIEESFILKQLILRDYITISDVKKEINGIYGYTPSDETIESAVSNLNFEFVTENKNGKMVAVSEIYSVSTFYIQNNTISSTQEFKIELANLHFKNFLLDNTNYSIFRWNSSYSSDKYVDGFILYKKYSRKDALRILNWKKNPVAQNVGGYIINPEKTHCPIFVNYHKSEDISSTTKYEDRFISNSEFEWLSKSKRNLNSPEIKIIKEFKAGFRIPLFVKKTNGEGADFYYMGEIEPIKESFIETSLNDEKGKNVSLVKIRFKLKRQVENSLFTYITNN